MRSRIPVLLTLLVSAALLLPAAPSGAAFVTEQPVPVAGGVTVTGHGFGHGRGMSQYGAQGAALRGVTWSQIIGFYYPGTQLGSTTGEMKIWLTADTDSDTVVLPKAGLSVADFGAGKVYRLPTTLGAKAWKLYDASGKLKVAYLNNGWHPYAAGGRTTLGGYAEFRTSSYTMTLRTPAGDRSYRGEIQRRGGVTINRTSIEAYLRGVVPREMPATWRLEALSAQAVAARTYAVQRKTGHETAPYYVCDTTSCQVYGGMTDEVAKSDDAVARTAGRIVKFTKVVNGKNTLVPAITEFSSSNGGWSAAGATQPYLVAQKDKFEQYSSNPNANWSVPLNVALLQKAYPTLGTLKSIQVTERDLAGGANGADWGGRVLGLKLVGSAGTKTFGTATGLPGMSEFRRVLGLKSTYFKLVPTSLTP